MDTNQQKQQKQRIHQPNQQQQEQQRRQGRARQRQELDDSHTVRHTIASSMPRRTLVCLSTTTRSTKANSEDSSSDELQTGRRTSAYQNAPRTGQRRNLAIYRPTAIIHQETLLSDTNGDSSASAFEEGSMPRHTDVPTLQSKRLSSLPVPQRLQPRQQSPDLKSTSKAEACATFPATLSRRPANAIHSTFSQPAATSHNRTESQSARHNHLSRKQCPSIETNSELDEVEPVSTVRTARRESITSSFARMETRQSNSPKQRPPPVVQTITQSKAQLEKVNMSGSDLPHTALEKRIGSLRTTFTEKQRLALQAIILGSQTRDDHPAPLDVRPSISKPATTAHRGKQTDGEKQSTTLLVDAQVDVADSSASASTDSYSGCDSTAGTAIMFEPSLETSVDPPKKRIFSAGVEPNNDHYDIPRLREEPTMLSQRCVGATDLSKVINLISCDQSVFRHEGMAADAYWSSNFSRTFIYVYRLL